MMLLKTDKKNFSKVLQFQKHGLKGRPKQVKAGELGLLAQLRKDVKGQKPITHVALYKGAREDTDFETDAIWRKHYRFVVDLENIKKLKEPFDLRDISVRNYDQVQFNSKITEDDAAKIINGGYLDTL